MIITSKQVNILTDTVHHQLVTTPGTGLTGCWRLDSLIVLLIILIIIVDASGVGHNVAGARSALITEVVREDERSPVWSRLLLTHVVREDSISQTLLYQLLSPHIVTISDQERVELGQQRILQLDPGLLLQRLECLQVVVLSEVFQTQSYCLSLPVISNINHLYSLHHH